ncbi:MAG: histidine phosphatase family protein [Lachnospiraceae bacterium]|nr:histidine phosphatase family protein [Lachnospiraceae bacterium]
MELVLYRHGETTLSGGEKRFLGTTECCLSPRGREQIRVAAMEYRGRPERIYCSPSIRCRESAQIFADVLSGYQSRPKIVYRECLREIHMGEWDGKTFSEVRNLYPKAYEERGRDLVHFRVPGGETFLEVQKRAVAEMEQIRREEKGEILIMTHHGVIRTLRCHYLGISLSKLMEWKLGYGQCCTLRI